MHGSKYVTKTVFVLAKNDFRKSFYMKPCVWLRMENRVFPKIIYFDRKIAPLTRKHFQLQFYLQIIFEDAQREKEREKGLTDVQTKREREIASVRLPSSSPPRDGEIAPWTHELIDPPRPPARSRHEPTNRSTHPSSSLTNPRTDRTTIGLVILIFFCFDFCFLCCLYASIICNNICLDPKKMWETW